jgi:hypothetical protein
LGSEKPVKGPFTSRYFDSTDFRLLTGNITTWIRGLPKTQDNTGGPAAATENSDDGAGGWDNVSAPGWDAASGPTTGGVAGTQGWNNAGGVTPGDEGADTGNEKAQVQYTLQHQDAFSTSSHFKFTSFSTHFRNNQLLNLSYYLFSSS